MQLSKVKTAELTGAALDWAVAKALDYEVFINPFNGVMRKTSEAIGCYRFEPSTNWNHGGPLIEEHIEHMSVQPGNMWAAVALGDFTYQKADTPLLAACRAIVSHHLGYEVEIPTDLTGA
ncbi:phage protein NinX family protein [Cronobacter turicensis]